MVPGGFPPCPVPMMATSWCRVPFMLKTPCRCGSLQGLFPRSLPGSSPSSPPTQRPVDRAPLGDLKEPSALGLLQRATQLELQTYTVDLPVLGLAFLAIPGVDLFVAQANRD